MRRSIRLLANFLSIVILFAILFAYAMFQGGFVSWFLFFSFLPIFIYHLGLLFYPIQRWKVTRKLSEGVVRAGNKVTVSIKITRLIPFPLYYCIVEEIFPESLMNIYYRDKYKYITQSNVPAFKRTFKKMIFPWFKKNIDIKYELDQVPRGEHELQAIRIKTGDIFGFIKKEFTYDVSNHFVAQPNLRALEINEQPSSFEQGTTSSFSIQVNQSNVASGVREYVPGDKFSQIDWKQTARKNTMMTKEFEQERSTDTVLIFDACHFKGINLLSFEGSVEILLSLSETLQMQGSNVGLLSIGEEIISFPMHQDQNKKEWIRKHLTYVQPTEKRVFSEQLNKETFSLNNRPAVIIVMTHVNLAFVRSIQKLKQRIKQLIVILVQSGQTVRSTEDDFIDQLRYDGVSICILTEKELMKHKIEVDI